MNELTCNSICQLLCCPPLPSKIAAKLAFMPPPASYQLVPVKDNDEEKLSLTFAPFLKESFIHFFPSDTEVTVATTRKGSKIATVYMHLNPSTKLTFLLSHGNAVDLGLMINFMHELGSKLGVNMMCYDYSGYGASTGKPLEKNLYADAECALSVLRTKFSVPLDQIILYGQSIGTVPTVYLATMFKVAAVVLHSPLMSGLRVAFPRLKRNYCCDVFSNLARAPRIISPTLVIHGTRDDVVHVNHGYRLCSALADHLLLDPLFIEGAGHNDCETFPQYLLRLSKLINVDIPQRRAKAGLRTPAPTTDHTAGDLPSLVSHGNRSDAESDTDLSSSHSIPLSHKFAGNSLDDIAAIRSEDECHRHKQISSTLGDISKSVFSDSVGYAWVPENSNNSSCLIPLACQAELHFEHENLQSSGQEKADGVEVKQVAVEVQSVQDEVSHPSSSSRGSPVSLQLSESSNKDRVATGKNPPNFDPEGKEVSKKSSFEDLAKVALPPPPPLPPISDIPSYVTSTEAIWSHFALRSRKTYTLPRSIPTADDHVSKLSRHNNNKICTLPRDMPSSTCAAESSSRPLHPDEENRRDSRKSFSSSATGSSTHLNSSAS